jgi:hypothetical protein
MAMTMCSVSVGGSTRESDRQSGASANFGKWWIQSKQNNNAQDFTTQTGATSISDLPTVIPQVSTDTTRSDDVLSISRFGFNFTEHRTDHFHVLFRERGVPATVVDETGALLERAYREFFDDFNEAGFTLKPVDEPLPWVVFDDEDQYRDFARLADGMTSTYLESYYAARSNQVVLMQASSASSWRYGKNYYGREALSSRAISGMDEPAHTSEAGGGGGLLDVRRAVHEAAHQLAFNTGLQKRGVMYPLWVSEGLATNFECDSVASVGVAGENAPRKRQLLRAYAGGRLMALESFVTLVHIRAGGGSSANDLYAQSWALFNFLFKTRQSDLKNYLAMLGQLEPGTRDADSMLQEFTGTFGSVERLNRAWLGYLNSQR